ncbi:CD3324 family protein [Bacillus sp. FJAT-22090]|uniref:CD3324 family protein n=1 Tax=Bacillus sp. FJAT-22090 TaxID=1581038 RepID=UPI0011A3E640|nr:CD3324 family protein [Bacillus sp. FJAT-22090]
MTYRKATSVLPEALLLEIQKYIQGEMIYIPKLDRNYKQWGVNSGERQRIDHRNKLIKKTFKNGTSIQQLAEDYFLSIETIKKIVYTK